MTTLMFNLTKPLPLTVTRYGVGSYVNGDWVKGSVTTVVIPQASVQPFNSRDTLLLPESDRNKSWVRMYTPVEVRGVKEGSHGADEFVWEGNTYKVMQVRINKVGVLNHYRSTACKIDLPNLGGHI